MPPASMQHYFCSILAKNVRPEKNDLKNARQIQTEDHSRKWFACNPQKFKDHENQGKSRKKELFWTKVSRAITTKCDVCPFARQLVKLQLACGLEAWNVSVSISWFWWPYCSYVDDVLVCGTYVLKHLEVMGYQMSNVFPNVSGK